MQPDLLFESTAFRRISLPLYVLKVQNISLLLPYHGSELAPLSDVNMDVWFVSVSKLGISVM